MRIGFENPAGLGGEPVPLQPFDGLESALYDGQLLITNFQNVTNELAKRLGR
jgi:hypothetical protein